MNLRANGRNNRKLAVTGTQLIGLDATRSGFSLAQKRASNVSIRVFWIESDTRYLHFPDTFFDGVYCFGLLHEFVGETAQAMFLRRWMKSSVC
jgi:ubiquinone/menaquinone biosynthesis C-methylase UbiE